MPLTRASAFPWLVAVVTFLVFLPALLNGFVNWDDHANFLTNPHYRGLGLKQLRWMLTVPHAGHYIPVTWLSLGFDYALWGMNPLGYHLTNVLLHGANAALAYLVLARLVKAASGMASTRGDFLAIASACGALFFSIHPLRVESVAWVTERRDVLSGLFGLLSLHSYLKSAAHQGTGGLSGRLSFASLKTSLLFFTLAGLSRENSATLLATFVIVDFYPLRRAVLSRSGLAAYARSGLREKIPFLVVGLCMATILVAATLRVDFLTIEQGSRGTLLTRISQVLYAPSFYLVKTAWPFALSALYDIPGRVEIWRPPYCWHGLLTVGVTTACVLARRSFPVGLAAWSHYVLTLLPPHGFTLTPSAVNDRYTYVAGLSFAALVTAAVYRGLSAHADNPARLRVKAASLAAGLLLAGLGALTWRQVQVWFSSETLWRQARAVTGRPDAAANLAIALWASGRTMEALRVLEDSSERDPGYADTAYYYGAIRSALGHEEEAKAFFARTLSMNPRHVAAHLEFASIALRQGHLEEALRRCETAILANPRSSLALAKALADKGYVLLKLGRTAEAKDSLEKSLSLNPEHTEAHNNLGFLLLEEGSVDSAVSHFSAAINASPGFAEAHANLGNALAQAGRLNEALECQRRALSLNPKLASAHYSMAVIFSAMGDRGQSSRHMKEALRMDPTLRNRPQPALQLRR